MDLWRLPVAATRSGIKAAVFEILAAYVDLPPSRICMHRGLGRPTLDPALRSDVSFNLSHSGRWALLAVTSGARIGVDIERVRPGVRAEALAKRFLSDREAVALVALPAAIRGDAFFRTWVRKEAYLKALGAGVPAGLSRFSVSVDPGMEPAIVRTELEGRDESAFSLRDLDVPAGYVGALAIEGEGHRIRSRSLGGFDADRGAAG